MYIKFSLKDLDSKYGAFCPDGSTYPAIRELMGRVCKALRGLGYRTEVYELSSNGLSWRLNTDAPADLTVCCDISVDINRYGFQCIYFLKGCLEMNIVRMKADIRC